MIAVSACLMALLGSAACGDLTPIASSTTAADPVETTTQAERAVTQLDLRSEDLVDPSMMATLAAACPAPTTCPGFGSCASWSAITACGSVACGDGCDHCVNPKNPTCTTGINRSTFTTQFRVCFNAQQQSCTEFKVLTSTTCQIAPTGDCCRFSPGTCGQPD